MKSVQTRSYLWSVFSCIQTEYGDLRSNGVISGPNTGKNGPEITPHLATSRSVRKLKTSYLVFAAINISEDLAEASLQKCSCKKMF